MQQLKTSDFKWHRDAPDVPDMSATQMKAFLDAPTEILMDKVNEVIGGEGAPSLKEIDGRTVTLEQKVVQLSVGDKAVRREVPPAVIEGAGATVDKALSHNNGTVLRFLLSSDVHQKNDHELITKSTVELGQAMAEILKLIDVDFVANLGDSAWGGDDDTAAVVCEQLKTFKRLTGVNAKRIYCQGNHDDGSAAMNLVGQPTLAKGVLDGLLGTAALKNPADSKGGYGYIDFAEQKVRVIYLNTARGFGFTQAKWFGEALQVEEGWSVLTMAHHPLDYGMSHAALQIIEAFTKRSFWIFSGDEGDIFVNFSNAKGKYIGHFHGHTHSYSLLRLRNGINGNYTDLKAWQMGIPNGCYTRTNEHAIHQNEAFNRFADEVTYHKENVDGKRTSFTLVTVCLDEQKIYLDNYGVGIDREVSYDFGGYTNLLPLATDENGEKYNGKGFKEDSKISSTTGAITTQSGLVATGFIPVPASSGSINRQGEIVLYISGAAIPNHDNSRVAFYDENKAFIGLASAPTFVTEPSDNNTIDKVAVWDENGYLTVLDISEICAYYKSNNAKTVGFVRLCGEGINENTIITVNEEIV